MDNIRKKLTILLSLIPLLFMLFSGLNLLGTDLTYNFLPSLSIQFHIHIDSLALLFLYLVNILIPITLSATTLQSRAFYSLVLLLQWLLIGFFTAYDLVFFTFFFEAMLLPLYFVITIWGGENRQAAAFKFLIYMIAGSVFMIAALLGLFIHAHTFNLAELIPFAAKAPYAELICGAFLLAFAVKTPLFPFHAWLPDTYCQAPTSGTILLSAILSKAGIYGIIRINLALFPKIMTLWSPLLLALAIAGVLYGAFAAWSQTDFKRLIAYSSLSHINFVLAGLFVWNEIAQSGAILQALNHSVTITGLFLVSGWLELRLQNTAMGQVHGLAKYLPTLCWITLFFVLSSVALPGLNNFIGEVMVLLGIFIHTPWYAAILALTVIFSVLYMLRFMQSLYFETPSAFQQSWIDLGRREILVALPLIGLILWLGIYPAPVLKQIDTAIPMEKTS